MRAPQLPSRCRLVQGGHGAAAKRRRPSHPILCAGAAAAAAAAGAERARGEPSTAQLQALRDALSKNRTLQASLLPRAQQAHRARSAAAARLAGGRTL
jgi:hypothetical protein